MKVLFSITLILVVTLFGACNWNSMKSAPSLSLNQVTTTFINEKIISNDSLFTLKKDTFEIGLYSFGGGTSFIAQKEILKPKTVYDYKAVRLYLVDSSGQTISFKNPNSFLKFMADKEFEVQDQRQSQYHTMYVFKWKPK